MLHNLLSDIEITRCRPNSCSRISKSARYFPTFNEYCIHIQFLKNTNSRFLPNCFSIFTSAHYSDTSNGEKLDSEKKLTISAERNAVHREDVAVASDGTDLEKKDQRSNAIWIWRDHRSDHLIVNLQYSLALSDSMQNRHMGLHASTDTVKR